MAGPKLKLMGKIIKMIPSFGKREVMSESGETLSTTNM
jgi:hypothetical protein